MLDNGNLTRSWDWVVNSLRLFDFRANQPGGINVSGWLDA